VRLIRVDTAGARVDTLPPLRYPDRPWGSAIIPPDFDRSILRYLPELRWAVARDGTGTHPPAVGPVSESIGSWRRLAGTVPGIRDARVQDDESWDAGVNVLRLNIAHGNHQDHAQIATWTRAYGVERSVPPGRSRTTNVLRIQELWAGSTPHPPAA